MSKAWLTPDGSPSGVKYIVLAVPDHFVYEAIVRSALLDLLSPENWQEQGDQTIDNAIEAMMDTVFDTISNWLELP